MQKNHLLLLKKLKNTESAQLWPLLLTPLAGQCARGAVPVAAGAAPVAVGDVAGAAAAAARCNRKSFCRTHWQMIYN